MDGDTGPTLLKQGAESKIYATTYIDRPAIIKERCRKSYRLPVLDKALVSQRIKSEVKSMMRCRSLGISTPAVYFVDFEESKIYMEYIVDSLSVRDYICSILADNTKSSLIDSLKLLAEKIGSTIGGMHEKDIIHGDLTTSNMLLRNPPEEMNFVLIDFGLGYVESLAEDKAVDLYVLERAFLSTHPGTEEVFEVVLDSYVEAYRSAASGSNKEKDAEEIISKLQEVRMRGRKRTMVG